MIATGTIPRSSAIRSQAPRGVLDRAALALGQALLAWADRRAAARGRNPRAVDREQLVLLHEAHREAERIALSRDVAKAQSYGLIR